MLEILSKNQTNDDDDDQPSKEEIIRHLHRVQSSAISLSVDLGELISMLKKQDPDYINIIGDMK